MSDEGGVAGAYMDTREQIAACGLSPTQNRIWSWLMLGALGAAITAFVAFQLAHQRHG